MLSAYVSVNPAVLENQGQEYKVRLRDAMNDDLVVRDPEAERCPFCGQQTRERPTLDALIDLAAACGARIDFIRGENENAAALHEFGGPAGLVRF
jgi:hypothetical protein